MPDINNPVMDAYKAALNISQNILDDEKWKFYLQAISGPIAYLWHSSIEAELDALWRNYT
jgi:hypothetical protein